MLNHSFHQILIKMAKTFHNGTNLQSSQLFTQWIRLLLKTAGEFWLETIRLRRRLNSAAAGSPQAPVSTETTAHSPTVKKIWGKKYTCLLCIRLSFVSSTTNFSFVLMGKDASLSTHKPWVIFCSRTLTLMLTSKRWWATRRCSKKILGAFEKDSQVHRIRIWMSSTSSTKRSTPDFQFLKRLQMRKRSLQPRLIWQVSNYWSRTRGWCKSTWD